jgi:hypothetical protein
MAESTPVFIGGAGRSGTTLVVDMLGLHPLISPIYETDFVLQLGGIIFSGRATTFDQLRVQIIQAMDEWTRPLPLRPHQKREHEAFHHGPHYILFHRDFALRKTAELIDKLGARDEPARAFSSFISDLFAEHMRIDGKTSWVNKTPSYVMALPLLKVLFPEMRFIHCVRDGRATACSAMTRSWGPKSVKEAGSWWVKSVKQGVVFGEQFPSQCLLVRYEDVVCAPAESLSRMLQWLERPGDSEKILESYQSGNVRLDASRLHQWKHELTEEDKGIFRQEASATLQMLGYDQ